MKRTGHMNTSNHMTISKLAGSSKKNISTIRYDIHKAIRNQEKSTVCERQNYTKNQV